VEDWSCARASFGDMHAIESVIPYLSEDGLQSIAYYAASSQEEDVLDYIAQRTNVDTTLNWMLAEENIISDEHEHWLRTKQNELQNLRIAQHLPTPTARVPRKI
jgi:pyrroloquinoline quinone (PQQ) biosynthesis protein C